MPVLFGNPRPGRGHEGAAMRAVEVRNGPVSSELGVRGWGGGGWAEASVNLTMVVCGRGRGPSGGSRPGLEPRTQNQR